MTVASFFLIRFDHREAGQRPQRQQVPAAHGAGLGSSSSPGPSSSTATRSATPLHATGRQARRRRAACRSPAVFALLLLGFGLKAGVFPLGQLWLPDAHSIAPSPDQRPAERRHDQDRRSTAHPDLLLHGPGREPGVRRAAPGAWSIAAIGVVTLFIGTVQALKQNDAKRLLAYQLDRPDGLHRPGHRRGPRSWAPREPAAPAPWPSSRPIGALYHVLNHAHFQGAAVPDERQRPVRDGNEGPRTSSAGCIKLMPVTRRRRRDRLAVHFRHARLQRLREQVDASSRARSARRERGRSLLVLFGIIALFTSAVTLACYVKFFGMTFTSSGVRMERPEDDPRGRRLRCSPPSSSWRPSAWSRDSSPSSSIGLVRPRLRDGPRASCSPTRCAGSGDPLSSARPRRRPPRRSSAAGRSPRRPRRCSSCCVLGLALASGAPGSGGRRGSKEVEAPTWLCGYQDLERRQPVRRAGHVRRLAGTVHVVGPAARRGLKVERNAHGRHRSESRDRAQGPVRRRRSWRRDARRRTGSSSTSSARDPAGLARRRSSSSAAATWSASATTTIARERHARARPHLRVRPRTTSSVVLRTSAPAVDPVVRVDHARPAQRRLVRARISWTCSGMQFTGHPKPKRLVLADDWPAGIYPLRKEVPYDLVPPGGRGRRLPARRGPARDDDRPRRPVPLRACTSRSTSPSTSTARRSRAATTAAS